MPKVKLKLAYDGTHYLGWQKTKQGPSIEETLENALVKFLQEKIKLEATSRTDAGVHARGQVVQFSCTTENLTRLQKSLNSMLPRDIAVWDLEIIPDFIKAKSKIYHYYVCNKIVQMPIKRLYSWHIRKPLDLEAVNRAAHQITGKQDFSCFCNLKSKNEYENYIRHVMRLEIKPLGSGHFVFEVEGDNFLYKMVRNIVGTLCHIGVEKIKLESLPEILLSEERKKAGITAPAHGLFLEKVLF